MSDQATIIFTLKAASKVHELMAEEKEQNLNLRVYITGGGCSGFQYGFTFDPNRQDDDVCVEQTIDATAPDVTVRLLIDPLSYPYLEGAAIDYEEDLQGAAFVIRNPNAKTTCGCGSSFSLT